MIEGDEPGRHDRLEASESPGAALRGAARAAVVLTIAGLLGQVFTLVRELFVAGQVGVSGELDALLVAAVAPLMLASLLASGTAAAIVPAYLATRKLQGRQHADRLLGAVITWTVLLGIGLTIVLIAGAGVAVAIAGPGLSDAARAVAIDYVPLVAPSLVFSAAGGLLAATCQIHDRMRAIAIAWTAGPAASLVTTVALWAQLELTALAIAMTIQQAVVMFVLAIVAARFRILPRVRLRADRTEAARFIRHALPLTISASVLQLNLLTDRAVATLITPGAVSALRYAEGVIRIPMNAVGPAWSAAIYPALVRTSVVGESASLGHTAAAAMRYVIAIFVPLSVATAALAPMIVEVAYVRGAFDARAATLTTAALVGFAPLLFLTMANSVLTGAHNARQRGLFLMSMGFLNAGLNATLNVGLGLLLGVAGIALSTSLTVGVVQFLKAWRLGSLDEGFPLGALLIVSARSLVASLLVAAPISLVAWNLPHGLGLPAALAGLVALTAAGMIGYVVIGRAIGLREPWVVAVALVRAPGRLGRRPR